MRPALSETNVPSGLRVYFQVCAGSIGPGSAANTNVLEGHVLHAAAGAPAPYATGQCERFLGGDVPKNDVGNHSWFFDVRGEFIGLDQQAEQAPTGVLNANILEQIVAHVPAAAVNGAENRAVVVLPPVLTAQNVAVSNPEPPVVARHVP